jgi:hypothetical protein
MALATAWKPDRGGPGTFSSRPRYRRIQAPIYHRPTSWFSQGLRRKDPSSISPEAGFLSYSDERVKPGRLLEMDVFLPDGCAVMAVVQIAWCDPLPPEAPARFDVGMRLVYVEPAAKTRLESVLAPP